MLFGIQSPVEKTTPYLKLTYSFYKLQISSKAKQNIVMSKVFIQTLSAIVITFAPALCISN